MECTKVNCPMQVGTVTENCGDGCPWRTTVKLDDLISRNAACDVIGEMIKEYRENGEDDLADGMILARRYGIKRLPAVSAVPVVHGRWIDENPDNSLDPRMRCSICTGVESPLLKWRYCPNCGAKMDGERRESE